MSAQAGSGRRQEPPVTGEIVKCACGAMHVVQIPPVRITNLRCPSCPGDPPVPPLRLVWSEE